MGLSRSPLRQRSVSSFFRPLERLPPPGASTPRQPASSERWPSTSLAGPIRRPGACCPSAGPCQGSHSFRPRGFPPPRRFPPRLACGLVASRSRPWGSSRLARASFQPALDESSACLVLVAFHVMIDPSELSPRQQPVRVTTACCLPAVTARSLHPRTLRCEPRPSTCLPR